MRNKRWQRKIEAAFDGEAPSDKDLATAANRGYWDALGQLRQGVRAVAERQEVTDNQFPAFMEGICEGIERPVRQRRGLWALASVTAAALIAAGAAFLVLAGETPKATATVIVEEADTDIEGATVSIEYLKTGDATVRLNRIRHDIL